MQRNLNQLKKELLCECYDFDIRRMKKDQYQNYILYLSTNEIFYLEKTNMEESEILFECHIGEILKSKGFNNYLKVINTKNESVLFNINNDVYVMREYIEGEDKHTFKDVNLLVNFLIKFHTAAVNCNPAPGTKPQVKWGKLLLYNKSCMTGLRKIVEDIKNQESDTEFKRIVCKYGDTYLKQAEEAYEVLKSSKYMDIVEKYMKLNSVCIGDFSKKKILRHEDKLIIKKLDNCCYDIPCTDIGRIIIKNIYNPLWCKEFLDMYMKNSKISKDELLIIYSMVLVPRETYKIIKRYYENKAGIDKKLLLKKLIEIVEQQELKRDVLDYIKQVST